ncbi:MAG: Cof-type HAD-IIB family hydrolase [Dehalococcoidales bacterium]|nr:Cof-type HAD-IIB family hydrolase [Dehalococcoidales bacterium]
MDYKLLVADIDGTLLDRKGAISTEDRNAIARAVSMGVRVSLCTGRVMLACRKIIGQLALDGYHIFADGALVSNPETGEEVYTKAIDAGVVRKAADFAHRNEVNMDFFSSTSYYIERENWVSDIRRNFFGIEPTIIDFAELWRKEKIIKGTMVVASVEDRHKADTFCRSFAGTLGFSWTKTPAYPDIDFINVLAPDVSKGKALEALASFLGIPLAAVMAIGNGVNDIPLLSAAGLAVAMGDAPDDVKSVADYVTLDVDHNGLAAAIDKFWH